MINSFSKFLIEEERAVYFTFGRMNPPTIGHGKLLDTLAAKAGRNPYKIYVSQSQDPTKNPLSYSDKIKNIRKMFPKHARSVMVDKGVHNVMDIATTLYKQGFRKIVMVVGSDRVIEFETLLTKYNGKESRHGLYNFADIKVISAGERDPDAEGVEGMSASKLRAAAKDNDFIKFSQGVPNSLTTKDTKKLFNDVRRGMGLVEEVTFKNHIALNPISESREAFVQGKLYDIGDKVYIKSSGLPATISILGSNYVIVETADGHKSRQWIDGVELVEAKASKAEADYQSKPHNNERCVNCTMFREPNKCTAVSGDISPNGWCKWFEGGAYAKRGKVVEEKTDRWYKNQPEWGTPEATKKAKQITPGQSVKEESKGLWYNIQQRRKRGLPRLKPGDKNYPKTLDINKD